ncbi:(2Fe-2S)-binding protein [Halomarina halobia]|uniref:(2Fe-2S)-binding protein n=1 Tax=Halomarina halobia TaxID=3033386 RepID=A0ABD6AFL0_9EURY|nr:(2Fe-2S)-binding protein [Halomarina sp. PSR21]
MSTHKIELTVNGTEHELEVRSNELLAHTLRDTLGYTGTNVGCESSICGACSVSLNGDVVKSCTVLAVQADGTAVRTVEGMCEDHELHPIQQAFTEEHGLQCGYCTPGMMMSAASLLETTPDPDEAEIEHALEGNLCRCTGYQNIVKAVQSAAEKMAPSESTLEEHREE